MLNIDYFMEMLGKEYNYEYATSFLWDLLTEDKEYFLRWDNNITRERYTDFYLKKASDLGKLIYVLADNIREKRQSDDALCESVLTSAGYKKELKDTLKTIEGITYFDVKFAISSILFEYFEDNEDIKNNMDYRANRSNLEAALAQKYIKKDVQLLINGEENVLNEGKENIDDIKMDYFADRICELEEA